MATRSVTDALEALLGTSVLAGRDVQAVWLFGSYAADAARETSDVDFAVLCEPPLGAERTIAMDQAARVAGIDVDVIDLRTAAPSLAWQVITTGRIVLERDERATECFVRHARFAAEDAAQRDRMVLLAHVGNVGGRTR